MSNNDITTILMVVAPAALVLASAYMILRRMLEADQHRRQAEIRIHTRQETLKIRLHAIEQLVALMEHLSPPELILRTARSANTAAELQMLLLDIIRKETDEYLAYQIYVSIDTWQLVVGARNTITSLVNQSAAELQPNEPAINLSKKIIENTKDLPNLPTADAIAALRHEAQHLFA